MINEIKQAIILYGNYPSEKVETNKINIKPALTLRSNIVQVKKVHKDTYTSYGRKFIINKESIIAILPIGYAYGYIRALYNKAKVSFGTYIGKICMNQYIVDVLSIDRVKVGNGVILIGEKNEANFTAHEIAKLLDTISY